MIGIALELSARPAMSETSTANSGGAAVSASSVPCERQTWPYVDNACSRGSGNTSKATRQIRVISTDRNTPAMIVTPEPIGRDAATPQPPAPAEAAPAALEQTPDRAPAAQPAQAEIVSMPAAAPPSADPAPAPVRTITVRSGSYAASRSDAVFVRVYQLPNGRRVTEYSNVPRTHAAAKTGRSLSAERVFVVPAEAGDAYAYAYAPR
jgi:hypothetical protein